MTGNIDATIRAALLLNANHLLQAAVDQGCYPGFSNPIADRFKQAAQTYMKLYHRYNTIDVWSDNALEYYENWDLGAWTQVETALLNMSEHEAEPYHKQRALDMVKHRLGMAEQDAEQEAIQW